MLDKRNIDYDEANQEIPWKLTTTMVNKPFQKTRQSFNTDTMGINLTFEPDSLHLYSVTFDDKNEVVEQNLLEERLQSGNQRGSFLCNCFT